MNNILHLKPNINSKTNTIQRLQMFNLILLMLIGKIVLNLPIRWIEIGAIVTFAILVEHTLLYIKNKALTFFSFSAVSTALGISFMLRTSDLYIYFIVILVALLQKHWLIIRSKHFLNPSNVAVVIGLMFFPYQTYTTPEQWGDLWWLGLIMMSLGIYITIKVHRVLIPVIFILTYALVTYLFITHNIYEIFHLLISGSFLLFMFFMLTDPRTSPDRYATQIFFAISIAILPLILELFFGAREIYMFLSLFLLTLTVPWLRNLESSRYLNKTIVIILIFELMVIVVTYFSNYNYIRNLESSSNHRSSQHEHTRYQNEIPVPSGINIWSDENKSLYKTQWNHSHIITMPLQKETNPHPTFETRDTAFKSYLPHITRKELGWEFLHHSPLAAGDINHDGILDIVMAKTGVPLRCYLGTKNHGFIDATFDLFGKNIPANIEYIALADLNNDTYLDMILLKNQYVNKPQKHQIYLFDSIKKQFKPSFQFYGYKRSVTGGIALYDLNKDKILDIYIAYDRDFYSDKRRTSGFLKSNGMNDQLWISSKEGWREESIHYMPDTQNEYAGMTALFSDLDQNGHVDFMLANDLQPTLTLIGDEEHRFRLIDKNKIPYNSNSSMSYLSGDFDNDGTFELWENCISNSVQYQNNRFKEVLSQPDIRKDIISREFQLIRNNLHTGHFNCDLISNNYVRDICYETQAKHRGMDLNDPRECDKIQNIGEQQVCKRRLMPDNISNINPNANKYHAERFPKRVNRNILLKRDTQGNYHDVLVDNDAIFTGWSWAAYPYDIDNNGLLDLYITTGAELGLTRIPNAMLINKTNVSKSQKIHFFNKTKLLGLDLVSDSRGVMIADFDNDGDGDIVVNTVFESSKYYQNHHGGDSISVELRSKSGNYYGVGSRIILYTKQGKQVQEIRSGGSWDSAQPYRLHFGIKENDSPEMMEVTWPNGTTQKITHLTKGAVHIWYE
ncbi:MAG: FG-GAP-like repeat-containing protein [Pseudomonadota bacterium]